MLGKKNIQELDDILSVSRPGIHDNLKESLTLLIHRSKVNHDEVKFWLPDDLKHVPYVQPNLFNEKKDQHNFSKSANELFRLCQKLSKDLVHNPINKSIKKSKTSLLNIMKELKQMIQCLHSLLQHIDESNLLILHPNFYASIKVAAGALKLLDKVLDWFTKNATPSNEPKKQHN